MRVAALYDIHGNLPALEAVLDEVQRAGIDEIVVGGDVFPGPMSVEALDRLLGYQRPVRFLRGNGDRALLALGGREAPSGVPEEVLPAMRWLAARLAPERRQAVASWPSSLRLGIDGLGDVLFCHATPHNDTDIVTRATPEAPLVPLYAGLDVRTVVCGHTHMHYDRVIGGVRVVNAGSVGMPFGEPGAYWLLLGPSIEPRRTDYDRVRAADRIAATGYPGAHEFAARNILAPPPEQEMLDLFSGSEVR